MKKAIYQSILTSVLVLLVAGCGQLSPATQTYQTNPVASKTSLEITPAINNSTGEVPNTSTLLPNGFASDTQDGLGLSFFALDGLALGEKRIPKQAWTSKNTLHIVGPYTGSSNIPLIYFQPSIDGNCDTCGLWLVKDEQTSQLMHLNDIEALVGVPGSDLMVFVERLPLPDSGILRSSMFLGNPSSLPTAQPVLAVDSSESLGIVPVAIQMNAGNPAGIFYTQRPFGIGGEILFDPLMGLFYLDLATKSTSEVLPSSFAFSSISQSQILVAYSERGTGIDGGIKIRDIGSQEENFFQVLPDSDRGAGMVVISPDDTRLAWLEARGSLSQDNFHATLRVASMDGKPIQEFPQEQFIKTAGLGEAIWVTPLGWLDNSSLLVGVSSMGKDSQAANLRLDVLTGDITYLAPGLFMGFLYP
jgi:hypothetical protein